MFVTGETGTGELKVMVKPKKHLSELVSHFFSL